MASTVKKCPICNGVGTIETPAHTNEAKEKKEAVIVLRNNGYSYRQIMRLLGYKSTNSIKNILK